MYSPGRFKFSELDGDLKCWLLLGLTLEDGGELCNLPNADKYTSSNPDRKTVPAEEIYSVDRVGNSIAVYLPTILLKQIKPLEEDNT